MRGLRCYNSDPCLVGRPGSPEVTGLGSNSESNYPYLLIRIAVLNLFTLKHIILWYIYYLISKQVLSYLQSELHVMCNVLMITPTQSKDPVQLHNISILFGISLALLL